MSSKNYWITCDQCDENLVPYYTVWSRKPKYIKEHGFYAGGYPGCRVFSTSYKDTLRDIFPFPVPRSGKCIKVKIVMERISE